MSLIRRASFSTLLCSSAFMLFSQNALAQVRAFIETLPEQERSALLLYAVEGLDQAEVAQALGTSPAAVKQAVLSARKKLREKFGE